MTKDKNIQIDNNIPEPKMYLSEKASEAFPQVQAGLVFAVRDVYNRIEVIGLEGGIEQCREL